MEEILKDLVNASSGAQAGANKQLYFNLNSPRNWIQPNSMEISNKLKNSISYLKSFFEQAKGFPQVIRGENGAPKSNNSSGNGDDKTRSKELLTAILMLDVLQQVKSPQFHESAAHEEFVRHLEAELTEHITPPDGLAMTSLDSFVIHNELCTFDMTALAISVLCTSGELAVKPAKIIAAHLRDQILGIFHSDSSEDEEIVDPVECCFVLRLLYQVEVEGYEEIQNYLLDYLEHKLYLDEDEGLGLRSPDAFLYFLSQAVAISPQETLLRETLVEHLHARLADGFGFTKKVKSVAAVDLSMRIISLERTGLLLDEKVYSSVTAGEMKMLLKMQRSDGGWLDDIVLQTGDVSVGGEFLSSLLGAAALDCVLQCK